MNRIYSEVVVITPAEAAEILRTKNKVNRAIDRRLVARLAASMKAGEWKVNGECIVFAPDGTLLDGQNRLSAIVKSGVAITTCVMYNVPEDARATMDSGKKRTAADVLRFMGYKNSNIMAPIVRLAYIYDMLDREMNLNTRSYTINTDIITRHAEYLNPEIMTATTIAAGARRHLKPSVVGFCYLVFSRRHQHLADEFFHTLKTQEALYKGHPVKILLDTLMNSYVHKQLPAREQIALYIKAWNAYVLNENLYSLTWNPKAEEFPAVL